MTAFILNAITFFWLGWLTRDMALDKSEEERQKNLRVQVDDLYQKLAILDGKKEAP